MTQTKQPMADRVAAHNAGQYDAELVGTKYEGGKTLVEKCIEAIVGGELQNRIEVITASSALDADSKKLAAENAILHDMLGELEKSVEAVLQNMRERCACGLDASAELLSEGTLVEPWGNKQSHMLHDALANAKLVREMK
jgi:hypothetical protein